LENSCHDSGRLLTFCNHKKFLLFYPFALTWKLFHIGTVFLTGEGENICRNSDFIRFYYHALQLGKEKIQEIAFLTEIRAISLICIQKMAECTAVIRSDTGNVDSDEQPASL
jgi:hypothetical protein